MLRYLRDCETFESGALPRTLQPFEEGSQQAAPKLIYIETYTQYKILPIVNSGEYRYIKA